MKVNFNPVSNISYNQNFKTREYSTPPIKKDSVSFTSTKLIPVLDKKTVQFLEKADFNGFLEKSREIINKSLGIPEELRCKIEIADIGRKLVALYDVSNFTTYVSPKFIKGKRSELYGILSHEICHQKQSFDIFRTEGLSDKWIECLANQRQIADLKAFQNTYRDMSLVDIEKLKPQFKQDGYDIVMAYKKAIAQGREQEFLEKLKAQDIKEFEEYYSLVRQKIVDLMSEIKQGTPEAQKAQRDFNGFLNGKLGSLKTQFTSPHEIEALGVQGKALLSYIFAK